MSKQDKIAAKRRAKEPYPILPDVLNRKKLDHHVNVNLVCVNTHDRLPLYIYDYTGACEKKRAWDQITTTCRGLVRDNKSRIITRPYQKFFAWGGRSSGAVRSVSWEDEHYAYEKLDGTMISAGNYNGQLVLSTRRTFDAWQIERALKLWPDDRIPDEGTTWMFEYVGPENRIVVPYQNDRLILCAVIDNFNGADMPERMQELDEVFETPEKRFVDSPEELLADDPGDGSREGWVAVWPRKNQPAGRLKIKYRSWYDTKEQIAESNRQDREVDKTVDAGAE